MRSRFITRTKKRRLLPVFSFFVVLIIFIIIYNILDHSKIKLTDQQLVTILLEDKNFIPKKDNIYTQLKNKILNIYNNPIEYLSFRKENLMPEKTEPTINEEKTPVSNEPLIYIYNSHQTEEYASSTFLEYTINPTVMMSNYILEEQFNNASYPTIVEERSIKEMLNENNWKYSSSYKASRIYLEDIKQKNPTLKYFVDVHRDSLVKEKTTIEINDKTYAKLLFIIGLENPNYEENLKFTEEINNKINEKYPNLSKGIYKKSGSGVNGVYNQDFSPYTILIEVGGYQNTPTEVMNSSLAFSECFLEVISSYELT